MKAAVCSRYGRPEVLQIQDLPRPTPKAREVLIKVMASTVSSGDCRIRGANFPRGFGVLARLALGWSAPRNKVLGTELSGVVEAVGSGVTRFQTGDEVMAFTGMSMGAHAEYYVMGETGPLIRKPANLSWNEAAALGFGGLTALYFLRDRAHVQSGESVLVVGASGAVGVATVQLAHYFGADVTAVCSGKNKELVLSLGAQRVIDYTQSDWAKSNALYDIIFDTTGTVSLEAVDRLKPKGRLILVAAELKQMLEPLWTPFKEGRKVLTGNTPERAEDLQFLAELASRGSFKAVIDRSFSLQDIAAAHAYADTGRKRGSVLVTIA